MSEPIAHADDATAYVLGTLGVRERRRFESRLKKSAELRKMVRLLEIGSIGLAMAAPRREPPTRLWEGIQVAVTREREKQERKSRKIWLRSAVGIAACAIVGWFAYTFWSNRASSSSQRLVAEAAGVTNSAAPLLAHTVSQASPASNLVSQPPRLRRSLRPGESATLRERVGALENQVAHLAQTVTQQQAVPPDFSPLSFLNIAPEGSDGTANGQMTAPSPELRRALLLGVARQLGWMPPTPPPPPLNALPPSAPPPSTQSTDSPPPASQDESGVQFVDLPPVETAPPESQTASVETMSSLPPASTSTTPAAASEENTSRNAASIPAYVSGTNLVFAIDSSVVPVGTEAVNFYSGNAGGPVVFRGTIALGNNAAVVTMPFLQVRAWNSQPGIWADSARLQPAPGVIRFNSTSVGNMASFLFTFPDPPSSSSP